MADPIYVLPENPQYDEAIRALRNSDPGNAETLLNPLFAAMLGNTHFVKLLADRLALEKANLVDGKVPLKELPPLDYDSAGTAEAVTVTHNTSGVAHTDIREGVANAQAAAEAARVIAEGRSKGVTVASYAALADTLNAAAKTGYKIGDNLLIVTVGVPDLWISAVTATASAYHYTTDEALVSSLALAGEVQMGYFKVAMLESQKVDLSEYVKNTRKINGKSLGADVILTAPDVGARADTWTPTAAEVKARPDNWTPTWGEVTGKPATFPAAAHSHTKADVGLGSVDNTADMSKPVSTAQLAALNGKAGKSTQVDATIGTTWGGSAGARTQAVNIAGVTATNVVEVFLRKGATTAQDEAYSALQLRDGGQAAGSITLLAKGDKNTVNVPITVIIRGDL